jgi:hypothetical protein
MPTITSQNSVFSSWNNIKALGPYGCTKNHRRVQKYAFAPYERIFASLNCLKKCLEIVLRTYKLRLIFLGLCNDAASVSDVT